MDPSHQHVTIGAHERNLGITPSAHHPAWATLSNSWIVIVKGRRRRARRCPAIRRASSSPARPGTLQGGPTDLRLIKCGLEGEDEVLPRELEHAQVQILTPYQQLLHRLHIEIHRRLRPSSVPAPPRAPLLEESPHIPQVTAPLPTTLGAVPRWRMGDGHFHVRQESDPAQAEMWQRCGG